MTESDVKVLELRVIALELALEASLKRIEEIDRQAQGGDGWYASE